MNNIFTPIEWEKFSAKLNGLYAGYNTGYVYRFPKDYLNRLKRFDPGYHWLQLWDNGKLVIDY